MVAGGVGSAFVINDLCSLAKQRYAIRKLDRKIDQESLEELDRYNRFLKKLDKTLKKDPKNEALLLGKKALTNKVNSLLKKNPNLAERHKLYSAYEAKKRPTFLAALSAFCITTARVLKVAAKGAASGVAAPILIIIGASIGLKSAIESGISSFQKSLRSNNELKEAIEDLTKQRESLPKDSPLKKALDLRILNLKKQKCLSSTKIGKALFLAASSTGAIVLSATMLLSITCAPLTFGLSLTIAGGALMGLVSIGVLFSEEVAFNQWEKKYPPMGEKEIHDMPLEERKQYIRSLNEQIGIKPGEQGIDLDADPKPLSYFTKLLITQEATGSLQESYNKIKERIRESDGGKDLDVIEVAEAEAAEASSGADDGGGDGGDS